MYSYTTTLVHGHALALHYDTSSRIYSYSYMCVPEAQGTSDVLPIAQVFPGSNAVTHLRHSQLAWCIDDWYIDCWAQILAASGRHINHLATRPQSPHTLTTQSTLTSDFYSLHSTVQCCPLLWLRSQIWLLGKIYLARLHFTLCNAFWLRRVKRVQRKYIRTIYCTVLVQVYITTYVVEIACF